MGGLSLSEIEDGPHPTSKTRPPSPRGSVQTGEIGNRRSETWVTLCFS